MAGACFVDRKVSNEIEGSCDAPGDCPEGRVCRQNVHRCIELEDSDVPPTLVERSVTPARASPTTTDAVTVAFTASALLAGLPVIVLDGAAEPDVVLVTNANPRFLFTTSPL